MTGDPKNYYKILNLAPGSSIEEIKKSYKKLLKKYHPDFNPGNAEAEEMMKKINAAYFFFKDSENKLRYDQGFDPDSRNPFDQSRSSFFGGESLFDLFNTGFDQEQHGNFFEKSPYEREVRFQLTLSLKEGYAGVYKVLEFDLEKLCKGCKGKGYELFNDSCRVCKGAGYQLLDLGSYKAKVNCRHCQGTKKELKNCKSCHGRKTKIERTEIKVKIPSGTRNNSEIIIDNVDQKISLLIKLNQKGFELFNNQDVFSTYKASVKDILFETLFEFKNFDDELIRFRIPLSINSGETIKIEKKGYGKVRGNLLLKIELSLQPLKAEELQSLQEKISNQKK